MNIPLSVSGAPKEEKYSFDLNGIWTLHLLLNVLLSISQGRKQRNIKKQKRGFFFHVGGTPKVWPPYCSSNQAVRPDESRPFVVKLVTLCKVDQKTFFLPLMVTSLPFLRLCSEENSWVFSQHEITKRIESFELVLFFSVTSVFFFVHCLTWCAEVLANPAVTAKLADTKVNSSFFVNFID